MTRRLVMNRIFADMERDASINWNFIVFWLSYLGAVGLGACWLCWR